MKECVYYHWFCSTADSAPYANLRAPIIVSIATLRAVSDIPIIVMDISDCKTDWSYFPDKLNFKVIRPKPELDRYRGIAGWQHLSRLFDLEKHAESDTVIYSDADVFWLKDPRPLEANRNKFCFDGYNTGLFYYDPAENQKFFEIFKAYTIGALNSYDIRNIMKKHVGCEAWYFVFDEMITNYMNNKNSELFDKIKPEEHGSPRRFDSTNLNDMKNLHMNGIYVRNPLPKFSGEGDHCRGLAGIIFSEFYNLLQISLGDDINKVFTPNELQIGLKTQFSLLNESQKLLDTLRSDGHYELNQKRVIMI